MDPSVPHLTEVVSRVFGDLDPSFDEGVVHSYVETGMDLTQNYCGSLYRTSLSGQKTSPPPTREPLVLDPTNDTGHRGELPENTTRSDQKN